MNVTQELLNQEASLGNLRDAVHREIKILRGTQPPRCWGNDDCSTNIMSQCPWRIDCDSIAAQKYQATLPI